ncbi:NAD(P)/FAD-dependent oxidoreductase [Alkalispirochaeta alkalica]|uniref:NAD(P)/FAD-dependent oxidoreductase n=1 Tax=Alkalispirochaeta alkalica TaxID=46356 RepID=UPI00035D98D2|nr:NAD(P)/FAD-dependent oxidoreductase [Alkalispirochaeta alkalica]
MEERKRIVILGGGYGGIQVAKKLLKRFSRNPSVEITLIDKNPYHTLMTELHEVAGSRTGPEAVQVSFRKIFGASPLQVVVDEITGIDTEGRTLLSSTARYSYDFLVIGSGGAPEFFDIPGVQEHSFTLWSLEDALRIRGHVERQFREAAKEPDPDKRRQMLTFVIAGAGFTGVELAGELLERTKELCPAWHIDEGEVRVVLVEAQETILPILPEKLQKKAEKRLRSMGGEILLKAPVTAAGEGTVSAGEQTIHTDTFIWTAGVHGGELSNRLDLTKGHTARGECSVASVEGIHGMAGCRFDESERYVVGQRGRLLVNDYMQSVDRKEIYLVGDVLWYVEGDHVVPQIVETALQTADTAAHNIIAEIEGTELRPFRSAYHGFMVSVGSKWGVAEVLGVSMAGFWALAMKHLVNLHYLFGLAGVNACWEYISGQFLTVKGDRSLFRGHLSWKVPVYWTVPLRLFLGGKWLHEGIKHIREGWLYPGYDGILKVWPESIHLPGVSFGPADAVSAATEGADAYGQPLIEALAPYTWFAENILSAYPVLAFLLQAAVVIGQIGIGLALIAGCFTFLAAGVSIVFSLMFISSGWGNPELLWYMAASLVMLGGGGRGFGLDHYLMPWLKRWWNKRKIAHKTYLYIGEPRD